MTHERYLFNYFLLYLLQIQCVACVEAKSEASTSNASYLYRNSSSSSKHTQFGVTDQGEDVQTLHHTDDYEMFTAKTVDPENTTNVITKPEELKPNLLDQEQTVSSATPGLEFPWSNINASDASEFFNGLINMQYALCPNTYPCHGSASFKMDSKCRCEQCRCDVFCKEFGDCCPEVLMQNQMRKSASTHTCVPQNMKTEVQQPRRKNYYMITRCPKGFGNQTIVDLCQGNTSIIGAMIHPPVMRSGVPITYINKYCAECHGIKSDLKWEVKYYCTDTARLFYIETLDDLANELELNHGCSVYYEALVENIPRKCYTHVISHCNETGNWMTYDSFFDDACGAYSSEVIDGQFRMYRNVFCYICNGNALPWEMGAYCGWKSISGRWFATSIGILLSIKGPDRNDMTDGQHCPDNHLYDNVKKLCRPVICPAGKVLNGTECISFVNAVVGVGYAHSFSLVPNEDIILNSSYAIHSVYDTIKKYVLRHIDNDDIRYDPMLVTINIRQPTELMTSLLGKGTTNVTNITVRFNAVAEQAIERDWLEKCLFQLSSLKWNITIGDNCQLRPMTNIYSPSIKHLNTTTFYQNETRLLNEHVEIAHIFFEVIPVRVIRFPPADVHENPLLIRVNEILFCDQIQLNGTEFEYKTISDTIYINHIDVLLNIYHYTLLENSARVCTDTFKRLLDEWINEDEVLADEEDIGGWLSFVCITVSLVSLALTLLTYCLFRVLRTPPGINNMFLIVTLFCAQALFQFGVGHTSDQEMCSVIGMIIHFLWLSAFAWMNICSFHMYKIFGDAFNVNGMSGRSLLGLYILYAYGAPLVIVCITISVNYSLGEQGFGYGGVACYLTSTLSRALAFILPLCLVLVSNIGFFAVAISHIRRSPKVESTAQKQHHILVYMKLSTVTGMSWVLGLISENTNIDVLSYLFIILNAGQGVLLFLSYVCNGRSYTLYRGLLGKQTGIKYDGTRSTRTYEMSHSAVSENTSDHIADSRSFKRL